MVVVKGPYSNNLMIINRVSVINRTSCKSLWVAIAKGVYSRDVLIRSVHAPFFCNIMSQVVVHVVDELQCMRLMTCHWLYYIERHTCHKKRYVGNMAKFEGTLAQGYSLYEALGLQ